MSFGSGSIGSFRRETDGVSPVPGSSRAFRAGLGIPRTPQKTRNVASTENRKLGYISYGNGPSLDVKIRDTEEFVLRVSGGEMRMRCRMAVLGGGARGL